mmetsp:Transcript_35714/g.83608  ORF Transcript_35714/g.83608 Transcript_35714/m.83608 type:complete len:779 (-) Transcript_35714:48-2384(-)
MPRGEASQARAKGSRPATADRTLGKPRIVANAIDADAGGKQLPYNARTALEVMLPFSCNPAALKRRLFALTAKSSGLQIQRHGQKATCKEPSRPVRPQSVECSSEKEQQRGDFDDLWASDELAYVAHTKARTNELRGRTAALLEKADRAMTPSEHAPDEAEEGVAYGSLGQPSALDPASPAFNSAAQEEQIAAENKSAEDALAQADAASAGSQSPRRAFPLSQAVEGADVSQQQEIIEDPLAAKIRSIRAKLRERAAAFHALPPSAAKPRTSSARKHRRSAPPLVQTGESGPNSPAPSPARAEVKELERDDSALGRDDTPPGDVDAEHSDLAKTVTSARSKTRSATIAVGSALQMRRHARSPARSHAEMGNPLVQDAHMNQSPINSEAPMTAEDSEISTFANRLLRATRPRAATAVLAMGRQPSLRSHGEEEKRRAHFPIAEQIREGGGGSFRKRLLHEEQREIKRHGVRTTCTITVLKHGGDGDVVLQLREGGATTSRIVQRRLSAGTVEDIASWHSRSNQYLMGDRDQYELLASLVVWEKGNTAPGAGPKEVPTTASDREVVLEGYDAYDKERQLRDGRRMSTTVQSPLRALFKGYRQSVTSEEDEKRWLFRDQESSQRQREFANIASLYNMTLTAVDALHDWFERLQNSADAAALLTPRTPGRRNLDFRRQYSIRSSTPIARELSGNTSGALGTMSSDTHDFSMDGSTWARYAFDKPRGDGSGEDAGKFRTFVQEVLRTHPEVQLMSSAWEVNKFSRSLENFASGSAESSSEAEA